MLSSFGMWAINTTSLDEVEINSKQQLRQWGIECKEPKDLFQSILPVGDNSINVENIKSMVSCLEVFFVRYEEYFNSDNIPQLIGLANLLRMVEPERNVGQRLYHLVCVLSQNESIPKTEDWSVRVAAILDKIEGIVAKCLLRRELKEFGQQTFISGLWGIVTGYANIEEKRGHVVLSDMGTYVARYLHSSDCLMSKKDWKKLRVTYENASLSARHLFFVLLKKLFPLGTLYRHSI